MNVRVEEERLKVDTEIGAREKVRKIEKEMYSKGESKRVKKSERYRTGGEKRLRKMGEGMGVVLREGKEWRKTGGER